MKQKLIKYALLIVAMLFVSPIADCQQVADNGLHRLSRDEKDCGEKDMAEPSGMTLRECMLYARQHAHRARAARLSVEAASTQERLTAASMMPRLDLYGNGNISFGRNIDPATNTYDNKQTLSTGFGVQASLPLFDGLVNFNNLRSAKAARNRQKVQAQLEEDEAMMEVIRQFYQVVYCKAMVTSAEEQLRRDSTDLAATIREERLGTKSGADVSEIEALVAADRYQLLNQRNMLEKAHLDLRTSMGMPLSEPLPPLIEDDFPAPVASESTEGGVVGLLPKLEEARLAVSGSRYDLLAAKGSYYPSVSLSGGISTSYYKMLNTEASYPGFARQARDNMGEYVGISIGIPLFDGLYNANRVKLARIRLRENELRLEETLYQHDKETAQAAMDYRAADEELRAARLRVEAEEIAFRATRRKYELGDASALDLYTAGGKLASAKATAEGKRIQKIVNLISWRYCLGIPLI